MAANLELDWCAVLAFGIVLDDGEDPGSVRALAAARLALTVVPQPDTSHRINRRHDAAGGLTVAHDDRALAMPWPVPVIPMSETDRLAQSELGDRLCEVKAAP